MNFLLFSEQHTKFVKVHYSCGITDQCNYITFLDCKVSLTLDPPMFSLIGMSIGISLSDVSWASH